MPYAAATLVLPKETTEAVREPIDIMCHKSSDTCRKQNDKFFADFVWDVSEFASMKLFALPIQHVTEACILPPSKILSGRVSRTIRKHYLLQGQLFYIYSSVTEIATVA